jgi:hypothetical protein
MEDETQMKVTTFYVEAFQAMQEVFEQADREADLIFGTNNETLPNDELELIFSSEFSRLSQPAKLQALTDFRGKKGTLPN